MGLEPKTSAYIWFDTEFTDLDLDRAGVLQVAALMTDANLQRLLPPDQDLVFFVKLNEGQEVSPWVSEHLASLVAKCRSTEALDLATIDARLMEWVKRAIGSIPARKELRPVLAGNSIHSDWFLVRKYLPQFAKCLHYRMLDVTTLKLLWQDWRGGAKFDKEDAALVRRYSTVATAGIEGQPHDAAYDVHASIAELNFYRQKFLS